MPVRLEPAAPWSEVKHSTTEPLRSLWDKMENNSFRISDQNALQTQDYPYWTMLRNLNKEKKNCVSGNRSENFRYRVGSHIFIYFFFFWKNITLCILKGEMPFKMNKIVFFFQENWKTSLGFTSKIRYSRVTLNTGIFFIWPNQTTKPCIKLEVHIR